MVDAAVNERHGAASASNGRRVWSLSKRISRVIRIKNTHLLPSVSSPRFAAVQVLHLDRLHSRDLPWITTGCKHLRELQTISCSVLERHLQRLSLLAPTLEKLDLNIWCYRDKSWTDAALHFVSQLTQLQDFRVTHGDGVMSNVHLRAFAPLRRLQSVALSNDQITAVGLRPLANSASGAHLEALELCVSGNTPNSPYHAARFDQLIVELPRFSSLARWVTG